LNDCGDPARKLRAVGGVCALLLVLCCFTGVSGTLCAAEPVACPEPECADYCTPRFRLHTDLAKPDAAALLKRLDCTLRGCSRFFGAPPRDAIEIFAVDRLDQWPAEEFTHPAARLLIGGVGGGVVTNGFDDTATAPRKVIVFAAALPGIPEHEIVHAYCVQTFGLSGPTWFKEGIAEMLAGGAQEKAPVDCPAEVIDYLSSAEPRNLAEVTSTGGEFTATLAASLVSMLDDHAASRQLGAVASMDDWDEEDTDAVRTARLEYHWCWSVCHFLHQHPKYNDRFKLLARGYVSGQPIEFDAVYAPVRDRLEFEYRFFVEHLEPGYRVDLCAWDWSDPAAERVGKRNAPLKITACRGYQPTGLQLLEGDCLAYEAQGEWHVSSDKGAKAVDADGNAEGRGRLEAVMLDEAELSEPFELGRKGKVTCPANGRLYVRCRDGWGEIADNRGQLRVMVWKSGKE
jgi:hypothetical protein